MIHEITVLTLTSSIIQGLIYIIFKNRSREDSFVGLCIFVPLTCTVVFSVANILMKITPRILVQVIKDLTPDLNRKPKAFQSTSTTMYEVPITSLLVFSFFLLSLCVTINTFQETPKLGTSAKSAYEYYGVTAMSNNVWFESSGLQKVFSIVNLSIFSFLLMTLIMQSISIWNINEFYMKTEKEISNMTSTLLKLTLVILLHTFTRVYENIFNTSCTSKALESIKDSNLLPSNNILYLNMGLDTVSTQTLLILVFVLAAMEIYKKWNLESTVLYLTISYSLIFNIILTICILEPLPKKQITDIFAYIFLIPILVIVYILDIYNFVLCNIRIQKNDQKNEKEEEDTEWAEEETSKQAAAFELTSLFNASRIFPQKKAPRRFD